MQTLPLPGELLFGSLDAAMAGSLRSAIAKFNAALAEDVPQRGDLLIDVEWLAQSVGLDHWYDHRRQDQHPDAYREARPQFEPIIEKSHV